MHTYMQYIYIIECYDHYLREKLNVTNIKQKATECQKTLVKPRNKHYWNLNNLDIYAEKMQLQFDQIQA